MRGDGQQLRDVPQPRREVPVRLVRGKLIRKDVKVKNDFIR